MAPRKKKKSVEAVLDNSELSSDALSTLKDIAAATKNKGYAYYNPTGLEELINGLFIEFNYNMVNPKNSKEYAVRATDIGIDSTMAKKNVEGDVMKAPVIGFEVGTFDRAAAKPKAPSGKRGRESKYHLEALEAGQFVFVPVNEKHASSDAVAKSLAGTVQAANKKFAIATGEVKTVSRKIKGSDERIEKAVPVTTPGRKYVVYGYNHNGIDGAAIVREM